MLLLSGGSRPSFKIIGLTLISIIALLTTQAAAHSAVINYVIGVQLRRLQPSPLPQTIQRQRPYYNFTLTVTDAKVKCSGGTSVGSTVKAIWGQWTHQQGPAMVWLHKCNGAFSTCDGPGQGWFKIDQMGMTAPPLTGTPWGTAVVYNDPAWTSTIPASLAQGNCLIRHEFLALHQADTLQFYAEFAQIVVTGGGRFVATIPGYTSQSDPGVMFCDDVYASGACCMDGVKVRVLERCAFMGRMVK
ncbi:uncharacterized protein BDZ99DRAFT_477588 [Mytilinidion resinicola]|uniref:AA9 family lytic polysaccharide monooxygenase n=1 Tax=Mytilinidion resinicola TaxID=574789 RepID=A0A6A6YJT5_9PEZI|nr:uncharacterized protein BDZ99DRAFT_477588 [Mytilinidion resinicola]KAF2809126.1 hypothetical protein BDZ99DRAFT_477588 [Mytilinidion resinicola]